MKRTGIGVRIPGSAVQRGSYHCELRAGRSRTKVRSSRPDGIKEGEVGAKSGQAMIEHVITAAMLMASVAIFAVLLYTFKEYGGRVLDLVASEYP